MPPPDETTALIAPPTQPVSAPQNGGEKPPPDSNNDDSPDDKPARNEMESLHSEAPTLNEPATVSYIPSQLYGSAGSEPLRLRKSPFTLLAADFAHGIHQLRYIPTIFRPVSPPFPPGELSPTRGNILDLLAHSFLLLLGLIFLLAGLALLFLAPAVIWLLYYIGTVLLTTLLCRALNYGPRILTSNPALLPAAPPDGEKWIFVNGICAGTRWLQENIDLLAEIFGRPVTGIHNRTAGPLLDLLECLIQRDFAYNTTDARITYNTLKLTLLNPGLRRVVLLAHSQGGIIVSNALDALFAELPPECFDKLEVYTFGCAANHFSNPLRAPPFTRQIRHIEHYVNSGDFVARIGVLRFVRDDPGNLYVGRVFTREGEGGHLLNQHYLQHMFYGDRCEPFLAGVVDVEEGVAAERGAGSRGAGKGWALVEGGRAGRGDVEMGREEGLVQGGRARGRTVRELSRLWRYRGGAVPAEEGEVEGDEEAAVEVEAATRRRVQSI